MKFRQVLILLCVALLLQSPLPAEENSAKAFLQAHCADCHVGKDAEAGLDLEKLSNDLAEPAVFARWVKIVDRVEQGEMPPADAEPPPADQQQQFVSSVREGLLRFNRAQQQREGRTQVRRLTRAQYERSVQDLLGISTPLVHLLPEETPLFGFDTTAESLRFSALHIDRYLAAADAALAAAIDFSERPQQIDQRFLYVDQEGIKNQLKEARTTIKVDGDAAVMFNEASYIWKVHGLHIHTPGLYRLRARAKAYQSERPVVLRLHAGDYRTSSNRLLGFFDVPADAFTEVEVTVRLENNEYLYPAPDGLREVTGEKNVWNSGGANYTGEGVALEWIEVEGPLLSAWPPASTRELFAEIPIEELFNKPWRDGKRIAYEPRPENPPEALALVIKRFTAKAFRRPVTKEETEPFVQLAVAALNSGRRFEEAAAVGLRGVLCSPQFLIHQETPGKLDDYALASRLAYFLTGAPPDETLLELAAAGKLSGPEILRQQTERLLSGDGAEHFVRDFTDQWLDLNRIEATSPDKRLYPEFDELLKQSMLAESRAYFRELIDKDLSVTHLIDADFAMLNRRLAEHYGLENVQGQQIRRTALPADSPRGGVLTQAAVLKVTANGTITSPVLRGSWVLTKLLNDPPAPPPPAVGSIEPDTRGATTIRQQLDLHRRDASCASCHRKIDPPGFALECFDVIGGFRTHYRSTEQGTRPDYLLNGRNIYEYKLGQPVDSSGELASGAGFDSIEQYKQALLKEPRRLAAGLAGQFVVYATGEKIEYADRAEAEKIVDRAAAGEYGVRSLVHAVVQSELFRNK